MDKRSLYDGLNSLETDLDSSVTQLREIKAALHELVEKKYVGNRKPTLTGASPRTE